MIKILASLLLLLPFSLQASQQTISLSPQQAQVIGQKIWQNEGAGNPRNLTVWNKIEAFPSFGIGHFIWYPTGVEETFTESFPGLIAHLKKTTAVPAWLDNKDAPWKDRAMFYQQIDSPRMKALRQLLQDTIPQQTEFIVQRMASALPRILGTLGTSAQRKKIEQQFHRVASTPNGVYALIDYINFKGEGISPRERYQGQGWGLLQVLENMPDQTQAVVHAFAQAADVVLTQRVANAPRDESRWLPGWRKRLQSYGASAH